MKLKIALLSIFFFNFIVYAAQIDTVKVFSKSMNKSIANVVITPKSYTTQKENYAVVYLLHGAGGDHSDWIQGHREFFLAAQDGHCEVNARCPAWRQM